MHITMVLPPGFFNLNLPKTQHKSQDIVTKDKGRQQEKTKSCKEGKRKKGDRLRATQERKEETGQTCEDKCQGRCHGNKGRCSINSRHSDNVSGNKTHVDLGCCDKSVDLKKNNLFVKEKLADLNDIKKIKNNCGKVKENDCAVNLLVAGSFNTHRSCIQGLALLTSNMKVLSNGGTRGTYKAIHKKITTNNNNNNNNNMSIFGVLI
jgi:hypothetical protein